MAHGSLSYSSYDQVTVLRLDMISANRKWLLWALPPASLMAVLAAYANHFHNSFHFDDFHTITQNPAIRSLAHVPQYFIDARTFSILPSHYSYHPLVTASAALDYWLGAGLNPFWFHVSTFTWSVVQLALMYLVFVKIMTVSRPSPANRYIALLAVTCYGLHPANAETINYIIQRADLYSTLGVVAGLAVFCCWPSGRKTGLYLLPVVAGVLSKAVALIFPAILFAYTLLFESQDEGEPECIGWARIRRSLRVCLPAVVVCILLAILQVAMTPRTFEPGTASRVGYWLTQPIVAFHYFKTFFLPTELSADSDRQLVPNVFSETSVIGLAFLVGVVFAIRYSVRSRETRPVAFGLLWFLIALLPTSIFPLAEPENDHRMFFPFVGLVLAVTWAIALFLKEIWISDRRVGAALLACALAVLALYGYGTHLRNTVWRSEESLWQDVVEKSPGNGRGLMNYGLTQLSKGNIGGAYDYFRRASFLTPNYSTLEINLGVAAGALHLDAEAEAHFRRAIALAPRDSQPYFYYGRWLREKARIQEAMFELRQSAALNPADLDPRYLLMSIHAGQSNWFELGQVAGEILRMAPGDPEALRYLGMVRNASGRIAVAEREVITQPTPENYLSLSQLYCQNGRYSDCVSAATQALRLRPDYAEAYNNVAAGYESMGRWDESIAAAREAIRLKPDFQLARNNLAYAVSQRGVQIARH
jgi:tetratricopeptide (TPR) repeat protein